MNHELPWPDPSIASVDCYRSAAEASHIKSLFGTDQPVAWITGSAADRVGRAIAKRFASRGYRIVIHGRSCSNEADEVANAWSEAGIDTIAVTGDVARAEDVGRCCDEVISRYSRIDVVIHAAAVWNPQKLEHTTEQDVREQFETNTLGSFLIAQQVGLRMVQQQQGGAILFVGDWSVARPYRDFAAYFTSKGAIETLTRTFAVELATRCPRVRVNGIFPGPVKLAEDASAATHEAVRQQCLLQCEGDADHIARAAVFLAEHEFITGVCLAVDGGRTIYAGETNDSVAHPKAPL